MSVRPFDALLESGLLWLFNRQCLHPRGYALALVHDEAGAVVGWELQGDGSTPFAFDPQTDAAKFAAVQALLAQPAGVDMGDPLSAMLRRVEALEAEARRGPTGTPLHRVNEAHIHVEPPPSIAIPRRASDPATDETGVVLLHPRFGADRFRATYKDEATANVVGGAAE